MRSGVMEAVEGEGDGRGASEGGGCKVDGE